MTALTLYQNTAASTSLATANLLVDGTGGTGGTNTFKASTCGTASGYSELFSQSTTNAWQALGAHPTTSPGKHGFLYDQATLEGMQIPAGNWGGIQRMGMTAGATTGDFYLLVYVYNITALTMTYIGAIPKTAVTPNSSNFNLVTTALPLINFGVGDRLYFETWFDITSASSNGASQVQILESGTVSQGDGNAKITTPGYQLPNTSWHIYGNEGLVF